MKVNRDTVGAHAPDRLGKVDALPIDAETGRALSIERVEVQGANSEQAYDADDKAPPIDRSNQ